MPGFYVSPSESAHVPVRSLNQNLLMYPSWRIHSKSVAEGYIPTWNVHGKCGRSSYVCCMILLGSLLACVCCISTLSDTSRQSSCRWDTWLSPPASGCRLGTRIGAPSRHALCPSPPRCRGRPHSRSALLVLSRMERWLEGFVEDATELGLLGY